MLDSRLYSNCFIYQKYLTLKFKSHVLYQMLNTRMMQVKLKFVAFILPFGGSCYNKLIRLFGSMQSMPSMPNFHQTFPNSKKPFTPNYAVHFFRRRRRGKKTGGGGVRRRGLIPHWLTALATLSWSRNLLSSQRGRSPRKFEKIMINLSLRTNLVIEEHLFCIILFSGKAPNVREIVGCSFGTAKLYNFTIIMGAKPPTILENHDKFVSENKSGNKGMSILRYFDLGWNRRFSRSYRL